METNEEFENIYLKITDKQKEELDIAHENCKKENKKSNKSFKNFVLILLLFAILALVSMVAGLFGRK